MKGVGAMEFSFESIQSALRDGAARTQRALEGGASFVRSSWGKLPFVSSVEAAPQHDRVERDETHYFLVPTPFATEGYALHCARRIPEGFATANDLPRLRVFHLPGPGADRVLESLVIQATQQKRSPSEDDSESSVVARLEWVADEIDRQSTKVTGGLLLIGGVVALANPLIGAGIAAKALLPSIGSILSRGALKTASRKILRWQDDRREKQRTREAEREIQSIPVVSIVNPLLATLERALLTDRAEFDPILEADFDDVAVEGWNQAEVLRLSARSIVDVYDASETDEPIAPGRRLGAEDKEWIEVLRSFAR